MALLQHVALQFEPGPLVRAGLRGQREGWGQDRPQCSVRETSENELGGSGKQDQNT